MPHNVLPLPTPEPAGPKAAASVPLLLGADQAAELCGVSQATWWRLSSAGRTPAPLNLGGRTLWRRLDLEGWIGAGCPDRREWVAMQAVRKPAR